jgi:hypothetical protein
MAEKAAAIAAQSAVVTPAVEYAFAFVRAPADFRR